MTLRVDDTRHLSFSKLAKSDLGKPKVQYAYLHDTESEDEPRTVAHITSTRNLVPRGLGRSYKVALYRVDFRKADGGNLTRDFPVGPNEDSTVKTHELRRWIRDTILAEDAGELSKPGEPPARA